MYYNEHFCRVGADAAMDLLPQGHQSLKYDLLHSVHLNLEGLDEQFKVAQALANGVIPNVYGINRKQKLKIGSKVKVLGCNVLDCKPWRSGKVALYGLVGHGFESQNNLFAVEL
ncbi:hypothetical protein JHK82_050944 [Glycine max]|nr:hypothetical protein JHK86_050801 [Glycine max]KAG4936724.1 hypothetical protein JHK85_051643 [Glycine max]KAG5092166.1 hypothetical protein JHK82_050944 [Glycine max]KAG5095248.1 hypothetical protein JHK84_050836 [Glycine max]